MLTLPLVLPDGMLADHHTLWLCYSEDLGETPLFEAVLDVMTKAANIIPNCDKRFKLNYVRSHGESAKHSYLWLADERIYAALLGFKLDGSPNIEQRLVSKHQDDFSGMTAEQMLLASGDCDSWANEDDEYVTVELDKILDLKVTDPKFTIDRAAVHDTRLMIHRFPGIIVNMLFVANLVPWVTEANIRESFIQYSTSANGFYPSVEIFNHPNPKLGRSATIIFDPQTEDARFALLMTKKIHFVNSRTREMTDELLVVNYVRKPREGQDPSTMPTVARGNFNEHCLKNKKNIDEDGWQTTTPKKGKGGSKRRNIA